VEVGESIGSGTYGVVYKGVWKTNDISKAVAIKQVIPTPHNHLVPLYLKIQIEK
jgi:serine/threonine protein kinase